MLLFFDLGAGEIFMIILVIVVVFGPKQIPDIARSLGKTINEMKRASSDFKNEINKEVQRIEREERYQEFVKQKADAASDEKAAIPGEIHITANKETADRQTDTNKTT